VNIYNSRARWLPHANIDRVANEGVAFTDYYRNRLHGRTRRVHDRPEPDPHR